jgi:hypothetical protein
MEQGNAKRKKNEWKLNDYRKGVKEVIEGRNLNQEKMYKNR